jgi:hypothetical protein
VPGRIRSAKKYNDFIGNRNRDLPACSIVPQLTTLKHARHPNDVTKKEMKSTEKKTPPSFIPTEIYI